MRLYCALLILSGEQLWSSNGTHTIFTATHNNHMWKIVRKAVAVAFSAACIRWHVHQCHMACVLHVQPAAVIMTPGMRVSNISCRQKFAMVRGKVQALAEALAGVGPEQSIDLDNVGMRLALDVVSLVSI